MKRFMIAAIFCVVSSTTIHAQDNFLSVLRKNQVVQLKEVDGRFVINIINGMRVGHKVIEVGDDYILIEEPSGYIETRIPVYSIKSIVRIKANS